MAQRTYRYFKGQSLYGFGYGLSYTTFAYSNVKVSRKNLKAGEPLSVDADVTNTGQVAGDEVAELYLMAPQTEVSARYSLASFERVPLAPGERRHVHFVSNARTLPRWMRRVRAR